ncbi:hypothetical protein DSO57_1025137 [Entomophthora muscae]|uniref:Uncharacterized protein n=1 Tax=Entomophthora muscae TaxID=34485 RepID=A0ACC2S4D9_9FUNG|nr:hypothetical protein DSO57_1025137 [Entomophthora muscae]
MVFTSNICDSTSNQASISQASLYEDEAQYVEAPVYTKIFDVGNKKADLHLTSDPYGFDLVDSYQENIPDINQILTEGKCWGKIGEFPIQEAKFDKEFPSLFGENKNKIEEKPDFNRHQINLSSGQAPTATTQTPASTLCQPPRTQPAASAPRQPPHSPAEPPPLSQPPTSPPHHPPSRRHARCQPPAHQLAPRVPVGCQPPT